MTETAEKRLAEVRARIEKTAREVGRDPSIGTPDRGVEDL